MTTLTACSDWHLGAVRTGGTTPATAHQLRLDLLANGRTILESVSGDLLINGDLFDGPDIPRADLLAAVRMFTDWLQRPDTGYLFLANGNHDLDKNATRLSSFQFFAKLLCELHPERVLHITEGTDLNPYGHDACVIPHTVNQDLYNVELGKVPKCRYLFVHANYDNHFAIESDHSLNLSREQAEALQVEHIVFAHEHQGRTELNDKVIVVGNNFPSSVSDCLGNTAKHMLRVEEDGDCTLLPTWAAANDFSEQDWRSLTDTGRFIRVTGTATAEEANQVVDAISRFRAKAAALVITNAVKIEGVNDGEAFEISHEQVTNFSVREALRECLTDEENQKVDRLLESKNG